MTDENRDQCTRCESCENEVCAMEEEAYDHLTDSILALTLLYAKRYEVDEGKALIHVTCAMMTVCAEQLAMVLRDPATRVEKIRDIVKDFTAEIVEYCEEIDVEEGAPINVNAPGTEQPS